MNIRLMGLVAALAASLSAGACARTNLSSVYTDIAGKACKKSVDDKTSGAYTLTCPGVGDYRLRILDDDGRNSIDVVSPDARIVALNYWDVVTQGFSTLGNKAEWRVARIGEKTFPVALIVRLTLMDQSDPERPKRRPVLVVAQIGKHTACVVKVVDATSGAANAAARAAADGQAQACLKSVAR
ncbi:hypothetical protein PO883_18930 [Massilia sp. DJPM01]|uniref:hypothetical protein n=1 Tax=Massilia sp. DJPM01 TaxID=3024404 RepID=UPI00259FD51F|nr:hypothetical protein [Massilia sp. DJPM01]MDM5179270.1 hypothetical protein [Massilia sp. DJPM01]